jgi:hypothetical protein
MFSLLPTFAAGRLSVSLVVLHPRHLAQQHCRDLRNDGIS